MKAEIKTFHCPDIDDLENFKPEMPYNFSFYLEMTIGSKDSIGEDIFGVTVCTPNAFVDQFADSDLAIPIDVVFVFKYDFDMIVNKLKDFVENLEGENWRELALQITKMAYWEFENYKA